MNDMLDARIERVRIIITDHIRNEYHVKTVDYGPSVALAGIFCAYRVAKGEIISLLDQSAFKAGDGVDPGTGKVIMAYPEEGEYHIVETLLEGFIA